MKAFLNLFRMTGKVYLKKYGNFITFQDPSEIKSYHQNALPAGLLYSSSVDPGFSICSTVRLKYSCTLNRSVGKMQMTAL